MEKNVAYFSNESLRRNHEEIFYPLDVQYSIGKDFLIVQLQHTYQAALSLFSPLMIPQKDFIESKNLLCTALLSDS